MDRIYTFDPCGSIQMELLVLERSQCQRRTPISIDKANIEAPLAVHRVFSQKVLPEFLHLLSKMFNLISVVIDYRQLLFPSLCALM